jgi:hypothetical protein
MIGKKWVLITVAIIIISGIGAYYSIVPFSMEIVPDEMREAVIGQMCVFLVSVENGVGSVKLSSTLTPAPRFLNGTPVVEPSEISSDQVAEITVYPLTFGNVTLAVQGERFGFKQAETITFTALELVVVDGDLDDLAEEIQTKFISWLAENHPEFGITEETEWTGTVVKPDVLVVMHYLFFSDEWEMGLTWHVTIEPHNWSRIYLRQRYVETTPSHAFQLSSWTAENYIIQEVSLTDAFAEEVWR